MSFFSSSLPDRLGGDAHTLARLAERLDTVETRSRRRGDTDTASAVEAVRLEPREQADAAAEVADEVEGLDLRDRSRGAEQ